VQGTDANSSSLPSYCGFLGYDTVHKSKNKKSKYSFYAIISGMEEQISFKGN
jgi:hypothetical protein